MRKSNQPIGYFYFSPWRKGREALSGVTEISYFLKKEYRGRGFGNQIMQWIEKEAKNRGFESLLAILLDTNKKSVKLLEKHHFVQAGFLPHVAQLQHTRCGQLIMLRKLKP